MFFLLQPAVSAKSQSILITPNNVRYLANVIDSSVTIDSRSIRFGRGTAYEKLLQVPIAAAGELDAHPPSESQLDSHLSVVTVILVLALVMELM